MVLTNAKDSVKAKTKIGTKDMKESVPRDLPVVHPYVPPTSFPGHLQEQKGNPFKIRKTDCMIHKRKLRKRKGTWMMDYDIPLHDGVMQPLTPKTIHITPPDDDYVEPATNLILDKHLNECGKELFDMTGVNKNGNFIKLLNGLSLIGDSLSIPHRVSQLPKPSNKTSKTRREMKSHQQNSNLSLPYLVANTFSWCLLLLSLALDFKFSQLGRRIRDHTISYSCGKKGSV
ncbi:hypothetical protein Tco_0697426 [Tanacetum coccineum]